MHKILVADEISSEGIDVLESALSVSYQPNVTPAELLEIIGEFDALLVRSRTKVTADVIKAGKKLKAVGRAGVGVDNIDLTVRYGSWHSRHKFARRKHSQRCRAYNRSDVLSCSEGACGRCIDEDRCLGAQQIHGSELFNKTLGVIGLGKVGGRVAHVAQSVGMKVIVYDPLITAEKAAQLNLQSVSLEEIWRRSDFITVHTPKTRETTNLISGAVLSRVKEGVRIINTSRGGVVDEVALARAIKEGRVAGAALDVFDQEPPPKDSPLLELGDKVILTPHLGASTVEAQFNVAIDLAEQMRDYLTSGLARSPVNLPFMRPEVLKSLAAMFGSQRRWAPLSGKWPTVRLKKWK